MAYATAQMLIDKFGEREIARLSSIDGAAVVAVDQTRCSNALNSATALVETYLRSQVPVPMTTPPQEVVDAVLDLARYELAHGGGREPTDQMKTRRDERIGWLKMIAQGSVQLAGTVPSAGPQGGRFSDRERIFSADSLRGFV